MPIGEILESTATVEIKNMKWIFCHPCPIRFRPYSSWDFIDGTLWKPFFLHPLLPSDFLIYRQKDLSIPSSLPLPVASKWPTFRRFWLSPRHPPPPWNSPHVPAPSSSPSISSGKCHPRIYSFARSRRLICSSRFPFEITFLFLFASISIERMKNRGGSLLKIDEERNFRALLEDLGRRHPRGKFILGQWRVIVRGGVVVEAGACGEVQIDRTLKQGREGNEGSRLGE